MINIVQKDTKEGKTLRKVAKDVAISDIRTEKLSKILHDMRTALESQDDGVALAAPQIGISKKIFIISPKAFLDDPTDMQLVFINPTITKKSKDRKLIDEGCLSVRPFYGKVRRASRVSIKALNADGDEFEMEGRGLLAQIFQHETDHLEGILFTDKAEGLKEILVKNHKKDE